MKKFSMFLTLTLVSIFFLGSYQADAKSKSKKMAVMMPSADIKWEDMKGGPPGIQYANLWGDVLKGAYGAFVKLPAGMSNPLHTHSVDTKMVVISGTFWIQQEGGEKKSFGAGSYAMIPGGWKHTSGTDGETMVFQEGSGKFDMIPVGMKKDDMMKH